MPPIDVQVAIQGGGAIFASLLFLGQGVGVMVVGEGVASVGLPAVLTGLGLLQMGLGLFSTWKIGRPGSCAGA